MRLLVVGFAASVHIARYLELLGETAWDVHLLDSERAPRSHPELPPVTLHRSPEPDFAGRVAHLQALLDELRPDVVHSHEIQHAGTLVAAARRERGGLDAPWLVTNWGSDITWWGRSATRVPLIRSVLSACDYYCSECHRDVALARALGFRGTVIGVWPVAGGIDLERGAALRADGPTSARRAIALKGAAGPVGRVDVALDAIERCADLLRGWELGTYQLDSRYESRVSSLCERTGIRMTRLSGTMGHDSPHDAVLAMHGRARVSIGLNRSDALSTSFLEALTMGSFPVQSRSSCGSEIVVGGRDALFVPSDDVDAVTAALRRALTDDALVDAAAERNRRAAAEHLDRRRTRARVVDAYERIVVDALAAA